MTLTVDSDLNGPSPQFTLTCISTGGPATTVTWTRDSVNVTEGTETVLDDPVTAKYTHTLTVTGRLGGLYTCTVANDMPSEDSANINFQGKQQLWNIIFMLMLYSSPVPSAPVHLRTVQEYIDSIRVSWTPSSDATGYNISYTGGGSSDSVPVSGGSTDNYLLTGLQNGDTYTIFIVATSEYFSSEPVNAINVVHLGEICYYYMYV